MSEGILSKDFIKKRKEYKEITIQLIELNNETIREFFKSVTPKEVNFLKETINKHGSENHKSLINSFCDKYHKGKLEEQDLLNIEILDEIYHELNEKEIVCKFYKNINNVCVSELNEIVSHSGIEMHKKKYKLFYSKYLEGNLSYSEIKIFKEIYQIYSEKLVWNKKQIHGDLEDDYV